MNHPSRCPKPKLTATLLSLGLMVASVSSSAHAATQVLAQNTSAPNLSAEQQAALQEAEQLNQQMEQLYQQGKYGEVIPLAEQALAIRKRVLGESHLDVATSLNNLAELYRAQGRYAEAEPL